MTCKISWIDGAGNPTPDDNPIYGYAICFAAATLEAIPICIEHAKRTPREGWMVIRAADTTPEKLTALLAEVAVVVKAIEDAFKDAPSILPTLRKASDHYSFSRWGMYVGVEPDGYIHT